MNLFESMKVSALNFPDKPAHILPLDNGARFSSMTYRELWQKSDALGLHLAQKYDHALPVLVFGSKAHEKLISFLACTKSGRAYIPIEASTPLERIRTIAGASKACALIDTTPQQKAKDYLPELNYLNLTDLSAIFSEEITFSDMKPVQGDEIYYVLFTSGSTGVPKGVQITCKNLEDFVDWTVTAYGYQGQHHLFLNQAPFNFDLSVYELYNSLATGGTILSLTSETIAELGELAKVLQAYRDKINVWVSTPSFLGLCEKIQGFEGASYPNLKQFVQIGEVLPKALAAVMLERFPKTILSNFYGPTEATVAATVFDVTAESLVRYPSIPIGTSKPGSKVFLVENEIILGGPNVSPGYLNDPVRTDERFFEQENVRCYRTGDLGHFDADGLLFWDGRMDSQVKLNGYRIELGEIEAQLNRIDFIMSNCVLPAYADGKIQSLCCFLTLKNNAGKMTIVELKKRVKQSLETTLPHYMIPKKFIVLESMPINANGKINRKELGEMI